MLCRKPYVSAGVAHGCGQCNPCRFNKRRIWTHRIMLEAAQYEKNAFVTLTYDEEHLPVDGSLDPKHVQDWLKRLRGRVAPDTFRYFLVGEYGDESWRPHYHAALFNFPSCEFGQSRYSKQRSRCCYWCELVRDTWGKGHVYLGTLEDGSAGYICGYVTKKMTKVDDERLAGRKPEFGRMSLRPGIGASAMWDMADALMRYELDTRLEDVPSALRHGNHERPLGRYLRGKLRTYVGKEASAPEATIKAMAEEMRPLREAAFNASRSFAEVVAEAGAQGAANQAARVKVYGSKKRM